MTSYPYKFEEIPLEKIALDDEQPRSTENAMEIERLRKSIGEYGIEQPIVVTEIDKNRYKIIDGHRRYRCAKDLELETIPCRIYPELSTAELETRRFEIQNNRKAWKPLEQAVSLGRIMAAKKFRSNKDLAEYLNFSETRVANALQLMQTRIEYLQMMFEYKIKDVYQREFIRLKAKLRKIKDKEVEDVVRVIFEKIRDKTITNAKDLRTLGWIFKRATINESEIYSFLTKPEMTIEQLDDLTIHSGLSGNLEDLIKKLTRLQEKAGTKITSKEKVYLEHLLNVIHETLEKVDVADLD